MKGERKERYDNEDRKGNQGKEGDENVKEKRVVTNVEVKEVM